MYALAGPIDSINRGWKKHVQQKSGTLAGRPNRHKRSPSTDAASASTSALAAASQTPMTGPGSPAASAGGKAVVSKVVGKVR